MSGPRVSIGVPVRNGERHMRAGLDSLLGQTFADLELIISDNASTDGTEAIGREYAERDPRVHYHRNPENIGLQGNFMKVLDLATAPYFMWGCPDDRWDPTYVEKMVAILDSHPSVVLAGGNAGAIDRHDGILDLFDNAAVYSHDGTVARARRFICTRPGGGQATLFYGLMRTPVIQRLGYAPPGEVRDHNRGYHALDLLTLFKLMFEGDFHVVEETLYFHRDTDLGRQGIQRIGSLARALVQAHGYYRDLRLIVRDAPLTNGARSSLIRTTIREEMGYHPAYLWRLLERRIALVARGTGS